MRSRTIRETAPAPVGIAAAAWAAVVVASLFAVQLVLAASGHGGQDRATLPFGVIAASMAVQWMIALGVLWFVSHRYLSARPAHDYALSWRPLDLLGIPVGVLSQLVVLELLYWPLTILFPGTFSREKIEEPAQELTDTAQGAWRVVLVVAVVVGAPLVEELLYRGLIQRSLQARINDVLAVLATAAWFALAHLQGRQLLGLFAFGALLGWCFAGTGRLGMGILAHGAFNATSLVLLW